MMEAKSKVQYWVHGPEGFLHGTYDFARAQAIGMKVAQERGQSEVKRKDGSVAVAFERGTSGYARIRYATG